MIVAGLHPNTTPEHVAIAKAYASSTLPERQYRQDLESTLEDFPGVVHAYALDSGRSALYVALRSLELPKGSPVGVCAYTCVVVRNAIIAAGYKPVYIDIDESLGIHPKILEKQTHIKALITQHTFGTRHRSYSDILAWAKTRSIPVIEDSAHLFDTSVSAADMQIHSFGPEKSLSAVRGGVLFILNKTYALAAKNIVESLPDQPKNITKKLMRTQLLFNKWRKRYPAFLTKLHIVLSKKTAKTMPILEPVEIMGNQPAWIPTHMGAANAAIALQEVQHLSKRNAHRKSIFDIYKKILPTNSIVQSTHNMEIPLELAIKVNMSPRVVLQKLSQKGIQLSPSWLYTPIVPASSYEHIPKEEQDALKGCKNAIMYSSTIVTIPTHQTITQDHATQIAKALLPYV